MVAGAGESLLFHSGLIRPFGGESETADALVIADGRVAAVGSRREVTAVARSRSLACDEIDLAGAVILPGLVDTHPHLLHYGSLQEHLVDLADARNHEEIVERIRHRAATTPPGEWIQTTPVGEAHYFIRRSFHDLTEGALPSRTALDRATSDHPVVIQAWAPRLPATIVFNSQALELLGIDRDTPDRVSDVWIEKDYRGEPTGRLHGSVTNYYSGDDFANGLWRRIPFLNNELLVPGTRTAMEAYNAVGVTSAYENHMMDRVLIDAYRALRDESALTIRVLTSQEAESYGMPWSRARPMPEFQRRLEDARDSVELDGDYFRFNGVSVMWDGTCFPGTMMMREPYLGPYGEPTAGQYNTSPEKIEHAMRFCAEHRLRLNTMVVGNRVHDENLTMLEKIDREYGIRDLHWVLVHGAFIEADQVRRYARLGMDMTTTMTFVWGKGDLYRRRIPDVPLTDLLPLRRLFDAGICPAAGTDWGPKNPFEQIELALTHEFAETGYRNLGPSQRVSRAEAVAMWTRHGGEVMRWEGIGTLTPGSYADLVVVDRDPVTCPIPEIADTRVLQTRFDGRIVFDADQNTAAISP